MIFDKFCIYCLGYLILICFFGLTFTVLQRHILKEFATGNGRRQQAEII